MANVFGSSGISVYKITGVRDARQIAKKTTSMNIIAGTDGGLDFTSEKTMFFDIEAEVEKMLQEAQRKEKDYYSIDEVSNG